MVDLAAFIAQRGYGAIAVVVLLGNLGLPVPEETVLILAGSFAWTGHLRARTPPWHGGRRNPVPRRRRLARLRGSGRAP
jgi:hypothetical protein